MLETIAIVIPCFEEERYIGRCLESLISNDYDKNLLDIVVVDGMSKDGTRRILEDYAREYSFIRTLDNLKKSKPEALNLGIENTTADVVMRIDAHATYEKNYISVLINTLNETGADNVGGVRETFSDGSAWGEAVKFGISHPLSVGNSYWRTGIDRSIEVDTVFCGCYRRDVFDRVGLFNESLIRTQDKEFNLRLKRMGGKIVLNPQAVCTYYPRLEFGTYLKWTYVGAHWLFYASKFTDERMTSSKNLVPSLFLLSHLVLVSFFLPIDRILALAVSSPLIFYYALVTLVGIKGAWSVKKPIAAIAISAIFPVTHLAYGAGALSGAIRRKINI
jgi:succinoglycan biosynthesis protein ExoA